MNLFHRLGMAAARYRYVVIAAWVTLLLAAVPFAPQLPGALRSGGFTLDDLEASKAEHALAALNVPPSAMVIVLQSTTAAKAGDPAFEKAAATAIANVPQAQHVTGVLTHLLAPRQISADGKTVYEIVTLDLSPDDSPEALRPVEGAITPVDGMKVMLAGGPAFYGDIQVLSENDLRRSEFISLPLAALALLLVFGSVVAAGVPIVVGGTAVVVALGALFFVAQQTALSIFVLNLATLLGLGLGVDYALLLTSRFREELKSRGGGRLHNGGIDQESVNEAVAATVATAGRAVFFSGLTVLLGLIGLILFEFMVLRSVGIAGAMVVGLAVASAVTLLPAVLATLGPRVDAYPVRLRDRVRRLLGRPPRPPSPEGEGAWGRLARRVMDHPLLVFIPTLTALLILGSPFLHAHFDSPDASILPPGVPSRVAFDTLASDFGEGEFSPLVVAVKTNGPVTDPANVALLYDYSRRLAADPRVTRVASYVDVDPRLTLEQYQLLYAAPGGPCRPLRGATACRDDEGRPRRLHRVHAVRSQPQRGTAARRRYAHARLERRAACRRERACWRRRGRGARRRPAHRVRLSALGSVHPDLDLSCAVRPAAFGRAAGQGTDRQCAVDHGQFWRAGVDLPGRQPVRIARLRAARLRRNDTAGDPVLRAVRAVDGLRGLPLVAYEGGLRQDRRQPRGRHPRHGTLRPHRQLGSPDRCRRCGLVRLRRHRPDQGSRPGRGHCRRA